ncbi:hypothetical protein D3C78_1286250 [compost metagenome]
MLQVSLAEARPQTDPEGVLHDLVGHRQLTRHSVLKPFQIRLASQVAGKQQTRADILRIKVTQ